jgi:hypothetical protein
VRVDQRTEAAPTPTLAGEDRYRGAGCSTCLVCLHLSQTDPRSAASSQRRASVRPRDQTVGAVTGAVGCGGHGHGQHRLPAAMGDCHDGTDCRFRRGARGAPAPDQIRCLQRLSCQLTNIGSAQLAAKHRHRCTCTRRCTTNTQAMRRERARSRVCLIDTHTSGPGQYEGPGACVASAQMRKMCALLPRSRAHAPLPRRDDASAYAAPEEAAPSSCRRVEQPHSVDSRRQKRMVQGGPRSSSHPRFEMSVGAAAGVAGVTCPVGWAVWMPPKRSKDHPGPGVCAVKMGPSSRRFQPLWR